MVRLACRRRDRILGAGRPELDVNDQSVILPGNALDDRVVSRAAKSPSKQGDHKVALVVELRQRFLSLRAHPAGQPGRLPGRRDQKGVLRFAGMQRIVLAVVAPFDGLEGEIELSGRGRRRNLGRCSCWRGCR